MPIDEERSTPKLVAGQRNRRGEHASLSVPTHEHRFTEAEVRALRRALPQMAKWKFKQLRTMLEQEASLKILPWGERHKLPPKGDRAAGLEHVARLANELSSALDNEGTISAELATLKRSLSKRLANQSLRVPRMASVTALRLTLGELATAALELLPVVELEPKRRLGPSYRAAEVVALCMAEGPESPLSAYVNEDHELASPYMKVLRVCIAAWSGHDPTYSQLRRPAERALQWIRKEIPQQRVVR